MRFIAAALIAFTVGGGSPLMSDDPSQTQPTPESARLFSLIPLEALGWKSAGSDQIFDRETIFDYIDGSGEVYRAFDMRLLVSRRFNKAGQADVIVDLFDMGSSADAFGIFAHDLEGEPWGIGQDSLFKGGLLQFWRGRYFVSIFAESENPETTAVLSALGKSIAAVTGPDGPKPDLIQSLPAEFKTGEVRWFHHPQILNYHFYIARENVLNLGPEAEGVLATVGARAEKRSCLLVRYQNEKAASSSLSAFLRAYLPETLTPGTEAERKAGLIRLKDGRFAAAGQSGRFFLAVFGETSAASARSACDAALKQLNQKLT